MPKLSYRMRRLEMTHGGNIGCGIECLDELLSVGSVDTDRIRFAGRSSSSGIDDADTDADLLYSLGRLAMLHSSGDAAAASSSSMLSSTSSLLSSSSLVPVSVAATVTESIHTALSVACDTMRRLEVSLSLTRATRVLCLRLGPR